MRMKIIILSLVVGITYCEYYTNRVKLINSTKTKELFQISYKGEPDYLLLEENLIIKDLILEIRKEAQNQIDIRIADQDSLQFRIPMEMEPFKSIYADIEEPDQLESEEEYLYNIDVKTIRQLIVKIQEKPFIIRVFRQKTNEVIFHIENLQFSPLYIEFTTLLCTKYFFGLGERNQKGFRFKEGTYTLYSKDVPEKIETGEPPGNNVYSSQPVYLMREKSGNYHTVFYKSASYMDVVYEHNKLTFKTIGGIIHLKFFIGDHNPENAIKLYHKYLGGFILHPFWSQGHHQSRWGYDSGDMLIEVIDLHKQNQIPLDTIWSDLDYMNDRQIFSVDQEKFTQAHYNKIQNELKINYVPLVDVAVGVKYGKKDKAFRLGVEMDIFLRSPQTGKRFKGSVWPGDAYYPDFFHPNITLYWSSMVEYLYQYCNYSGIWIDMNEPTNFCDGECSWTRKMEDDDIVEVFKNEKIMLPYVPGETRLDKMSLPIHLKHYGELLHKDVHNLYGLQESYYTYLGQSNVGKVLPFSISRSTFPGSGRFTAHWTGDNSATWAMMYMSVGQIFQFNIFGMPLTGADICGFMKDTTEELCARWVQLGSLYPFLRNHNNDQSKPQELYSLGDVVLKSAQRNIRLRYSLLKWYYMLFIRTNYTGTVFRPLFFEYGGDQQVFEDQILDTQFLLGNELMAAPILSNGVLVRKAYFPKDQWYYLISGLLIQKSEEQPKDHLLFCKIADYVPIFIRGGAIIFQQKIKKVVTSHDLGNHVYLVVALDAEQVEKRVAIGNFLDIHNYFDDKHVATRYLQTYFRYMIVVFSIIAYLMPNSLQRKTNNLEEPPKHSLFIDKIKIYGLNYDTFGNEMECHSDKKNIVVQCRTERGTFETNSEIIINDEFGLEFGGEDGISEIVIKF